MSKRIIMFPGLGSQRPGMGKELYAAFPEARQIYEEVEDALGMRITEKLFNGSREDLGSAVVARPGIMATSIAVVRVIEKQSGLTLPQIAEMVTGHSLGEYTALVAAGSLSLGAAARFIRESTDVIEDVYAKKPVGMVAIQSRNGPLDRNTVVALAQETGGMQTCELAAHNADNQFAFSGYRGAIDQLAVAASDKGWRATVLETTMPAHSSLMLPGAHIIREGMFAHAKTDPVIPFVSNATAQAETDIGRIRDLIIHQVSNPVNWHGCMTHATENGVTAAVECGAGRKLAALAHPHGIQTWSVQTPAEIYKFIEDSLKSVADFPARPTPQSVVSDLHC